MSQLANIDFVFKGAGHGSVAKKLLAANFDPGVLRPFIGDDGRTYISRLSANGQQEVVPVTNAVGDLRFQDWLQIDAAVVKAAVPRLQVVADIRGAGLTYTIPNGMGTTALLTERQTNITDADVSMSGLRRTADDRPEFDNALLPLPIIHKDFTLNARELAVSRKGGSPLDLTNLELASRRVAEMMEKMTLGTAPASAYSFGSGNIYGFANFPQRIGQDLTDPTSTAWTPATTLKEVLSMRQKAMDAFHFGPYNLYTSVDFDQYLDDDYIITGGATVATQTLRQRIEAIKGINKVQTADFLGTGVYIMILVQMTPDVVREVIGMELMTLEWENQGGMELNFKVMGIIVPQLRADINGNTGIVYGTVPA